MLIGTVISFVMVMFVRMDIWVLLLNAGWVSEAWLASLPTYELKPEGGLKTKLAYVWMWPITAALTFAIGIMVPGSGKGERGRGDSMDTAQPS